MRTRWSSLVARLSLALLLIELFSGSVITFGVFNSATQWTVTAHAVAGLIMLAATALGCRWYLREYRRYEMSQDVLPVHVVLWEFVVCLASGWALTWQGMFGIKMWEPWRGFHFHSTLAAAFGLCPMTFNSPGR